MLRVVCARSSSDPPLRLNRRHKTGACKIFCIREFAQGNLDVSFITGVLSCNPQIRSFPNLDIQLALPKVILVR